AIIQEMEFKQQQMEAQTTAAYEMIANLENDMEAYNTAMAENDEAEAALQKEIDALMAKLREEEAAAAAAAEAEKNKNNGSSGGGTGGSVMGTGDFRWPVDCYLITSEYGYRIHPIQNVTKFHAGVDIGAQSGQSIYASAAGTVAVSTYNDSYGNYVLINHGGGNATLYAHMSSTAVTAGQYVSQGQVIGYVGSTGWSSGPHLHFEIRLNGSTVNPLQFFSGYTIYNG
ncbi:MAG: M23 family metallopeptidase, partial [Oscillospiraceae bacterium]|nr:M23 family metallopeptidase [Oscillospiraceae bacterium]